MYVRIIEICFEFYYLLNLFIICNFENKIVRVLNFEFFIPKFIYLS